MRASGAVNQIQSYTQWLSYITHLNTLRKLITLRAPTTVEEPVLSSNDRQDLRRVQVLDLAPFLMFQSVVVGLRFGVELVA